MDNICFRVVEREGISPESLTAWIVDRKLGQFHAVREVGKEKERPHYHIWLKTEKSWDAIRESIKRQFKLKGNEDFAKSKKEPNFIYLAKGTQRGDVPDIFGNISIDIKDVELAHLEYWDMFDKNAEKRDKEKTKKESWFEQLVELCRGHGINGHSNGWEIAEVLIEIYKDKKLPEPNDFQLASYCKSLARQFVWELSQEKGNSAIWENYKKARAKRIIGMEWVHPKEYL